MFGKKVTSQLLTALIAAQTLTTSAAPSIYKINKIVNANDLVETSRLLTADPQLQWPIIKSPEVETDEEKVELAKQITKKIFEDQDRQGVEKLPALLKLSSEIERAGGYSNYVIADTINRLAAATLVEAISRNEIPPEKAFQHISAKTFFPEPEEWEKLLSQEAIQLQGDLDLKNAEQSQLLKAIYTATGKDNVDNLYYKMGSGEISTSSLLQKRDIGALARRMAETETYWNAQMPALIFFLKNGGEVEKIDLNDVRKVREILNSSPETFHSPLLNLSRVNALHIKRLYEDGLLPNDSKRILLGYK